MASPEAASVVLSVVLASAAILAVYCTLGQRVEKAVVRKQTADVVRSLLADATLIGDSGTAALHAYLATLRAPNSAAADAAVAASNAAILRKAAVVVGLFVAAGFLAAHVMASRGGFSISQPLAEAARSTVLAAGTEAAFLLCIGQNFVSADPQAVRLMILDELAVQASPAA